MAKKTSVMTQVALRIPTEALKRADALIPKVARDSTVAALGEITRSTILKLAVMRGLDALEKEHK
jgi:hypothetical protein